MIICHFKNLITNKNYHTPINILLIILMFNQIMITDTQKIYRSNRNNEKYDFLSPSKKFMKYSNFSKVIQMGRKNSINQAVLISSKVQQSSQPLSTLSSLSTLQQTQESPSHKISFSNDTPESILTNQQPVDNIYQLETDDFVFAQKFVTQVRNSVEQKQSTQLKQFQAPNFRQASQKNQNAIQNSLKSVQSNIMVPKIISGQISVPHSFRNTQDIYEKKVIQNLKFEGLILYHQIPLKLFQRQIFEIRGKLKSIAGIGGIYINLILRQADTGQRYSYAHFVKPEQSQFSFKINFSNLKGLFYLSFFPGYEGSAQPQIYEIIDQTYLENIKTTQIKPPKPQRFKVQVRQNKVLFSWIQNTKTPLNKLTFKQQNQTIEYLLSNFQTYFEVNEADFAFFKPGKVQARLSSAFADGIGFLNVVSQFSQSELISFEACQHQFTEYDSSFLELQDFKWRFNINQTLIINGKSLKQLKDQIIILNPNKSIESLRLNKQNSEKFIKPNVKISKLLKFQIPGVYIIEINRLTGGAALNRPVYVGQAYPILPDIFDLSKKTFEWKKMTKSQKPKLRNITQQIQLLLNLTNEKRRQFNVDPVSLDQTLGRLALKHTNDMIENNYFNHIDLQQRTPQQRAKQMGIQTKIGQNIAMNINLTQAHYKLCRSPIHLQNMVSSQWYSVGFGINVTQYGVFYVTQQFSTRNLNFYPFSQVQYDTLKRNIVSQIVRQNPEIQAENKQLSEALKELLWVGKTVNEEIGFKLASLGYSKFSVGYVKLIYTKNLIQKLSGKSYFNPKGSGYKFVSVALSTSQQDYLTITVVYT